MRHVHLEELAKIINDFDGEIQMDARVRTEFKDNTTLSYSGPLSIFREKGSKMYEFVFNRDSPYVHFNVETNGKAVMYDGEQLRGLVHPDYVEIPISDGGKVRIDDAKDIKY